MGKDPRYECEMDAVMRRLDQHCPDRGSAERALLQAARRRARRFTTAFAAAAVLLLLTVFVLNL
jgi:predicted nucleic acid-binding Zn ribbon protein